MESLFPEPTTRNRCTVHRKTRLTNAGNIFAHPTLPKKSITQPTHSRRVLTTLNALMTVSKRSLTWPGNTCEQRATKVVHGECASECRTNALRRIIPGKPTLHRGRFPRQRRPNGFRVCCGRQLSPLLRTYNVTRAVAEPSHRTSRSKRCPSREWSGCARGWENPSFALPRL